MELIRTNSENEDFIGLVKKLDDFLSGYNGHINDFYRQFHTVDTLKNCIVAYSSDTQAVGCGAFKIIDEKTVEIKRMFTLPEFRGQQYGYQILSELEKWAAELGFTYCVLETGTALTSAQKLYQNSGYQIIPNYGHYKGLETSICFQKNL